MTTTIMADAENTNLPDTIQEEPSPEETAQTQETEQNGTVTEAVTQEGQETSVAGAEQQPQQTEEGQTEVPAEPAEAAVTPGAEEQQEVTVEEDKGQEQQEEGAVEGTSPKPDATSPKPDGTSPKPDETNPKPEGEQTEEEEEEGRESTAPPEVDQTQEGPTGEAPTEQTTDGEADAAAVADVAEGEEGAEDTPKEEGEVAPPPAEGEAETAGEKEGEETPAQEGMGEQQEEGQAKSPVPQADTFEEGEKPESPVAVGEKLSREGSPSEQMLEPERTMSPPVPGSPGQVASLVGSDEEEGEEDDEEEEYEEPQYDREQLIERYHQALSERQQLQEQNYQLQHKLAEYFRRKKADDRQDMDKNVTDQEQRYLKYMANLDELRRQDQEERETFKLMIEEMKERCEDRQGKVTDEQHKFTEFKKEIALGSLNSRSGKTIPPRDVEQYFINESRKEEEVIKVRLENIKLKNKLKKKEAQLKSKEELAEGLHMIDFEQLKIENQTYNEKIEERNEELLKLRKKITSTVQVLTHLKEKLQFVTGENGHLKTTLLDVEEHAGRKRDILSRTKQARDALRIDNQRLRQNCGLLGNESLLRDFEERKDESDDLREQLDSLKTLHAELTLNLNGVRRKIQQAQVGRQ